MFYDAKSFLFPIQFIFLLLPIEKNLNCPMNIYKTSFVCDYDVL